MFIQLLSLTNSICQNDAHLCKLKLNLLATTFFFSFYVTISFVYDYIIEAQWSVYICNFSNSSEQIRKAFRWYQSLHSEWVGRIFDETKAFL